MGGFKSKLLSVVKVGLILVFTFIISASIVILRREPSNVEEYNIQSSVLEEKAKELDDVKNTILTTQKSIDELEKFIKEKNN